jgi:SPP1 gp7 family putative phage head morphogenesis protein
MQGVFKGYGGNFSSIAYDTPDYHKLAHLERNVYSFSGAKNWQMLRDLTDTVKNTGNYREFRNKAITILDEYQGSWLKTEYNAAIAGAQMASKWVDFEKHPTALLEYRTMEDGRVREDHRLLDKVTRPVNDAFWKTYYPPNGWNCRCTVIRLNGGKATPQKDIQHTEVPKMFRVNLGQEGLVFPKGSAYYINCPKDVVKQSEDLVPDRNRQKIVFEPAASIRAAQAWAKKNGIAHKIDYKKAEDIDIVNTVNKALYEAKNNYGVQYDTVKFVSRASNSDTWASNVTTFHPQTGDFLASELHINVQAFKALKDRGINIDEHIASVNEKGYWVPKNFTDIVNHEIGHYLTVTKPTYRECMELRNTIHRQTYPVSKYGLTSGTESLAEIWCLFRQQGIKALKQEWIDFFNKHSKVKI